MTSQQSTQEFYRSVGIGDRVGGGERPALVVIDLTRAFTESGYQCSCHDDVAFANVVRLLDLFRSACRPVLFTAIEYQTPDGRDGGHFVTKMPALRELLAGSTACELDPRLERRDDELLITKQYTSSFFGTSLASALTVISADTLVIVGASTSGCVRASVVDAVQLGFRALVPADAVADRAAGPHNAALFDIDSKYGDVVSTDQVVVYLDSLSPPTLKV